MDVQDSPLGAALAVLVAGAGSLGIVDRRTQRRLDHLEDRQVRTEQQIDRQSCQLSELLALTKARAP